MFSLPIIAVFDLVRRVLIETGYIGTACLSPVLYSLRGRIDFAGDPNTSSLSSSFIKSPRSISGLVEVERPIGSGIEFVGRRAKRLPPPGEGGRPVEGMLNDLVFFIGDRSRLSMVDDEGCRFEGEIGVGGAVGRAWRGSARMDVGDVIP